MSKTEFAARRQHVSDLLNLSRMETVWPWIAGVNQNWFQADQHVFKHFCILGVVSPTGEKRLPSA